MVKLILITFLLLQSCKPCVVDIYHDTEGKQLSALKGSINQCYYTITKCNKCNTKFLDRRYYDNWAEEYIDLGLKPPHPKRSDQLELYSNL